MDIEELKERKKRLSDEVIRLADDFEKATGLTVDSISIRRMCGINGAMTLTSVELSM